MTIIIIACVLLLLSYIFDLTSSKTKIPSVILLLILGYGSRIIGEMVGMNLPDMSSFLSIFGTIGLILIVLEGSIDLELNRSKLPVIGKSLLISLVPMVIMAFILAFVFQLINGESLKTNLLNVVPLAVISSAIAIPSVKNLMPKNREFIIYESSFSDILGVLFFTFLYTQDVITIDSFGNFGGQVLLMFVISFVATIVLVVLLSKIDNHIKFAPIIILIILIFSVSEIYHLPALIFIFIFGLFLGNIDKLERIKLIQRLNPVSLNKEVKRFSELINEGAFLIRSLFFLIFGFLIETEELLNLETLAYAVMIVVIIFGLRWLILKLTKIKIDPLLYVAPRGLITILLFLRIPAADSIPQVSKSLVIQVIVLTAIVLMVGLITSKGDKEKSAGSDEGDASPDSTEPLQNSVPDDVEVVEAVDADFRKGSTYSDEFND